MKKKFEQNQTNKEITSSRNKSGEVPIISKIADYQTSMSAFSTGLESKTHINLSSEKKEKKSKEKKRVEINPLITVINIQSYKKENYNGYLNSNDTENKKEKKCFSCAVI